MRGEGDKVEVCEADLCTLGQLWEHETPSMSLITDSAAVRCCKADKDMHVRILRRNGKVEKES